MQEILSNGKAGHTPEVLQVLRDMHPPGRGTVPHSPNCPQLVITQHQAQRSLFVLAGKIQTSTDCFGWSASLLYPLRGKKTRGRYIPFIHQVARLVARIGSARVPAIFAHILTCGNLVALHKLEAAEQAEAAEKKLPLSLRPVNQGCNFLKWALRLAVRSKAAQSAARKLEPLQCGLVKRGPELYCHSLRALRERGWAILKTDFANGFNALSRQAVLDAVQERCPELTSLFNLFYAVDGACFFALDGVAEIIWSAEGVRMGCPLGSFGFDLALQAILNNCANRHPKVLVRSLTDDCNLMVHLPGERAEAKMALKSLRDAFTDLKSEAQKYLNLELNLGKCALLLPQDHVLLPEDAKCFEDTKVEARGMRVAGAPIGNDEFCAEFVGAKVDAAKAKIGALRGIHPQVGLLLLMLHAGPNYLAQIVPPSLTVKHFDMEVADFVLELMSLAGAPGLPCPDARLLAFKQRLRLPMRYGGAGLVGVDSICAAAFTGSVIACAELDTILADNIDGLERFAQPTLDLLSPTRPPGPHSYQHAFALAAHCPVRPLRPQPLRGARF